MTAVAGAGTDRDRARRTRAFLGGTVWTLSPAADRDGAPYAIKRAAG